MKENKNIIMINFNYVILDISETAIGVNYINYDKEKKIPFSSEGEKLVAIHAD